MGLGNEKEVDSLGLEAKGKVKESRFLPEVIECTVMPMHELESQGEEVKDFKLILAVFNLA